MAGFTSDNMLYSFSIQNPGYSILYTTLHIWPQPPDPIYIFNLSKHLNFTVSATSFSYSFCTSQQHKN